MATLIHCNNPFAPLEGQKRWSFDGPFIECLEAHYPRGFDLPYVVMRRGGREQVPLSDFEFVPDPGEIVVLIETPFGPLTPFLIQFAVTMVVSLAVTYLSNLLFPPPDPDAHRQTSPSPVYSFQARQNSARLGDPIPTIYGRITTYPNFASQPYVEYQGNDAYYNAIMCIGWGKHILHHVLIENDKVASLPPGTFEYQMFNPEDHGGVVGKIFETMGIAEDMVTSPLVDGLECSVSGRLVEITTTAAFNAGGPAIILGDEVPFKAGATITIEGSASNDGTYTISSYNPDTGRMVVAEAVINEGTLSLIANITEADLVKGTLSYTQQGYNGYLPTLTAGGTYRLEGSGWAVEGQLMAVTKTRAGGLDVYHYDFSGFDDETHQNTAVAVRKATAVDVAVSGPSGQALVLGWFVTNGDADAQGNRIDMNFVFPNGIYAAKDSGAFGNKRCDILIEYQEIDENDDGIGEVSQWQVSFNGATNTPQRFTRVKYVPLGRYRVRVRRTDDGDKNSRQQSRCLWEAYKFRLYRVGQPAYGNVTLLAVRIRSSAILSASGNNRIRADVSRSIKRLGNGGLISTDNPADIMVDIMTDPENGAGRPIDEVDLETLTGLRAKWEALPGFNGQFDQRSTIFVGLQQVLLMARARPVAIGGVISAIADGPQDTRVTVFSPENIIKDSLRLTYLFRDANMDYDGYEVNYSDPKTFTERSVAYPANASRPKSVDLLGCTDRTFAGNYAQLLWQQDRYQRKSVTFDTELEGHVYSIGDRIGVAHPLPNWGDSARLAGFNGQTLTLDRDVAIPPSAYCFLRDQYGGVDGPIPVTQPDPVGAPAVIQLQAAPTVTLYGQTAQQEPTYVAFGTGSDFVRDFTITRIEPGKDLVSIAAIVYDPRVWQGTLKVKGWNN